MTTTVKSPSSPNAESERRDAFLETMMGDAESFFRLTGVYLGDQLGLYAALSGHGAQTPAELADRTDTDARYVREWLEQQTAAGVLATDEPERSDDARRYRLPPGHDEVLADPESLNFLAPLAQIALGAIRPLDALVDAFRSGAGIPYAEYGRNLHEGQARMNRNAFLQELPTTWLSAMPEVVARLQSGGRVADIGCGHGWSCIGMAVQYPAVQVDGIDLDESSIEAARRHAEAYEVADRGRFFAVDAGVFAQGEDDRPYDLVLALECVHDMTDPVRVLKEMRRLAGPDGAVLVVDERTGETFDDRTDIEPFLYGFSVTHCLPVGRVEDPAAGTGTVMCPGTLRAYATEAGFASVEVLPVENVFFRLYRLHP
jgi:ubiquinone/menaquinone biosynthesis C-methylase UbiE